MYPQDLPTDKGLLKNGLTSGTLPHGTLECPICLRKISNPKLEPVRTECLHWFCRKCLSNQVKSGMSNAHKCALCRCELGEDFEPESIDEESEDESEGDSGEEREEERKVGNGSEMGAEDILGSSLDIFRDRVGEHGSDEEEEEESSDEETDDNDRYPVQFYGRLADYM